MWSKKEKIKMNRKEGKERTMDIKEQITNIVEKVTKDEAFKDKFEKEPIKAVEEVLGVDLPDEIIEQVIQGVKAKLSVETLSQVAGAIKKLF